MSLGIFSAVIGGLSFLQQRSATKKQAKAQEEAVELQQEAEKKKLRATNIANRRKRIQAIRQARKQRGEAEQGAVAGGVGGGSSVQGFTGGLQSSLAATNAFVNQLDTLSTQATNLNIEAGNQITAANEFGAQADVFGAAFQATGGFENIFTQGSSIFSSSSSGSTTTFGAGVGSGTLRQ